MAGRTSGEHRDLLTRVQEVLGAFTEDEPTMTASRVAARTGLARSTVHRLLTDLVRIGFLAQPAVGSFVIGARLWEIGELSPVSLRLREVALPILQQLHGVDGEVVHLAVLTGGTPETAEALYVGRVAGPGSIPTLSRTGGRHPLHTTGVGKALLMTQDEVWLERYFLQPLERETLYSVTEERALRDELAAARRLGYATTHQEMTLGNMSVAAPVPAVEGLPQAAVGVVSHLGRADVRRVALAVRRAAEDIAAAARIAA
jgi:DNA-binding IclR family transcriptional regulator